MTYNLTEMTNWELDKANFIIQQARALGMDMNGYGEVSVNQNSGYVYLWPEDYPFTLYMPISCEVNRESVFVLWTNPEDGEEIDEYLTAFKDMPAIYEWVESLENQYN
jgi:hypothetical protein